MRPVFRPGGSFPLPMPRQWLALLSPASCRSWCRFGCHTGWGAVLLIGVSCRLAVPWGPFRSLIRAVSQRKMVRFVMLCVPVRWRDRLVRCFMLGSVCWPLGCFAASSSRYRRVVSGPLAAWVRARLAATSHLAEPAACATGCRCVRWPDSLRLSFSMAGHGLGASLLAPLGPSGQEACLRLNIFFVRHRARLSIK